MGANPTGSHVAFGGAPGLDKAAHEAAYVVHQQTGVQLSGGVAAVGEHYEQHVETVADAGVRRDSPEQVLAQMTGAPGAGGDGARRRPS